ncbi:MAG TPA: hypothetical protein VKV05_05590 [Terriglobales bacterium]|nr:hypothetical protein [Terriglobales bacterium]
MSAADALPLSDFDFGLLESPDYKEDAVREGKGGLMNHVEILFKEYDTLRAEIISRTNNAVQLGTAFAALGFGIVTWSVSRSTITTLRGVATLAGVILALVVFYVILNQWLVQLDIDNAAARLRELESQINRLCGAELLRWETHWGGAVTGPLRKKKTPK